MNPIDYISLIFKETLTLWQSPQLLNGWFVSLYLKPTDKILWPFHKNLIPPINWQELIPLFLICMLYAPYLHRPPPCHSSTMNNCTLSVNDAKCEGVHRHRVSQKKKKEISVHVHKPYRLGLTDVVRLCFQYCKISFNTDRKIIISSKPP